MSISNQCHSSFFAKVLAVVRSFRERRRRRQAKSTITVEGPFRPLLPTDIPLVVVSHNDGHLARAFLAHYRQIGVTRFLWLDDASTDDTRTILDSQPDVDVLTSNVRYREAKRGRRWRELIVDRYGRDRWYLMVDADEFLVYSDFESTPLRDLINGLERRRIRHLFAPMVDMYPSVPLRQAAYDGLAMPWSVANLFDAEGYVVRTVSRGWHIEGGPRARLMSGKPPLLTKYPLIYWTAETNLTTSTHFPGPYQRNFAPPMGALLHFKYFSDSLCRFKATVANGQHFDGALLYKSSLSTLEEDPDMARLRYAGSVKFSGSAQMRALAFFKDWR